MMKGKSVFLVILALITCAPSDPAQISGLRHPLDRDIDPTADAIRDFQKTGVIREVSFPREQTVKQLRLLLAPAGITVEEEQFEDWRRFKNNFSVIVEWDARPGAPDVTELKPNTPLSSVMTVKGVKKWEGSPGSLPSLTLRQGDLFVAAVDAEARLRW